MENPPVDAKGAAYQEAHLRDYWKIVWQARWTVAAIFFVVVGLTAVWTFVQPRIFRSTTTIEVQPQANRLAAGQDVSGLGVSGYGWFAEEKYHNTQVEIIQSRKIAEEVFTRLRLEGDEEFANLSDPVGAFRQRIAAIPRRETGLIEISITGTRPEEITSWVNEVAQAYVDQNLERATRNVERAMTKIREQMQAFESEVSAAEEQRFEVLKDSANFSSEEQGEIIKEKLLEYNAELNRTQIELSRLSEKLNRIRELQRSNANVMSIPELAEDQNLRELLNDKIELERQLESYKVELRPGHQLYQQIEGELEKVGQRLQDRVSVILGTLQNKFDLAQQHADYLKGEIRRAEERSVLIAQGRSGYELIKTRSEIKKHIFDLIAKTINEVQIGQELMSNNVSILDEATVPLYPIKPRRKLNLMIGAVLGLFLGIAAAFFLDYLDNTFRTPDDIEKHLGLSVLGVIPKMGEDGLSGRASREAYQSLRTSVIFSSKNHRRKVILITSTGPQEGKSSTVAELARMLATAGDRVVIVDCDLRRPVQHEIHEARRDYGLTNYLAAPIDASPGQDRTDWTAFIKTVQPPNLHVLASGPIPPSPPELLGSERFAELLAMLRESYDWVLIDSPPAASLADATLLASLADMLVLVVKHARTDRDLVVKTVQRLRAVDATIAGVVLNSVDLGRAYHKDYYYAGADYYHQDGDGKSSDKRGERTKASVG